MSKVLSAVAWPYANGPRHIGHVAGFGVPSDVFSRYMRMAGHDVLMVSGTDEHGTPILVAADAAGASGVAPPSTALVTTRAAIDCGYEPLAAALAAFLKLRTASRLVGSTTSATERVAPSSA